MNDLRTRLFIASNNKTLDIGTAWSLLAEAHDELTRIKSDVTPEAYCWRGPGMSWQYSTWFDYADRDVADKRARGCEVKVLMVMP